MTRLKRSEVRHLVMRAALAFVLGWFGTQELHNPSGWGVFVPGFVTHHASYAVNDLVLLHGFMLTLAAASILLGLVYLGGSLLATGLLCAIILQLWIDGGVTDVLIRDVGVLGLATALLVDPVRVWHLDDAILSRVHQARVPKKKKAHMEPVPVRVVSWTRIGSGGVLALAVLAFAAVLRVTGTSGSGLPPDSSVFASAVTPAVAQATVEATPVPTPSGESVPTPSDPATAPAAEPTAAPAPGATVTSIRFADWRYRDKSFQVYPGPISSETKQALAGFDLTVQDQGSQVTLFLKALSTRYHDASIPLDRANTAYFVETSMHDDPNDRENNLNDDGVVVVNPDGYVVQS